MILAGVLIIAGIISIFGVQQYIEKMCGEAYVEVDKCSQKHDLDACKKIYLPRRCEKREEK